MTVSFFFITDGPSESKKPMGSEPCVQKRKAGLPSITGILLKNSFRLAVSR